MFFKKHIGRPTNKEMKLRKIKKVLIISLPILLVTFISILIYTKGDMSKLMGNSVELSSTGNLTAKDYVIRFYPGKGSGKMSDQVVTVGNAAKVNQNHFTPPTSQTYFDGWAVEYFSKSRKEWVKLVKYDGKISVVSSKDYIEEESDFLYLVDDQSDISDILKYIHNDTDNSWISPDTSHKINFTAHWNGNVRIAFNANGGSGYMKTKVISMTTKYLPAFSCNFTKNGYVFDGWRVYYKDSKKWACKYGQPAANCEEYFKLEVKNISEYNPLLDSNIVLYANWRKINVGSETYTISFNPGDGFGTMADQVVTWGVTTNLNDNKFTKNGYSFSGWRVRKSWGVSIGTEQKWFCYTNPAQNNAEWAQEDTCQKYGFAVISNGEEVSKFADPGDRLDLYAEWGEYKTPIEIEPTISYNCPSGYTKIGDGTNTSYQKKESGSVLKKVKGYSCPAIKGVTLNGAKCNWKISALSSYSCPSGYTKIGDGTNTSCQKKETAVNKYTTYCSGGSYWTKNGSKCEYQKQATYKCPSGYTLASGKCTYKYKATVKNRRYTCPNGGSVNGSGQCVITKTPTYICPTFQNVKGSLKNRTCYYSKNTTKGTTKVCNKGYLSGNDCIINASATVKYTCAKGYTKSGNYCTKSEGAMIIYDYYCSSGYTKTGNGTSTKCTKTTTKAATKEYVCPSGYKKVGSGSNTKCEK